MQIGKLFPGLAAAPTDISLGLGDNWRQFALLVTVNLFVGGMIGMERSILPGLAEAEFGVTSKTAIVSFIATFGLAMAVTNLVAGSLARKVTRRRILITGWLFAIPVPFMLIWAPSWGWVIAANVLLGINQGLAWSRTVNMKMDLVGTRWRGLALGFNEAAGYTSLAAMAFITGIVAENYGLRPEPFYLGIGIAAIALAISVLLVRDTAPHLALEHTISATASLEPSSFRRSFADVTWRKSYLFGITQAGLVKNLNDGVAWGVFPLYFASQGLELNRIATLVAVYPLVWGCLQSATGWASDLLGRKQLIVAGMVLQGVAISLTGAFDSFPVWIVSMSLLGFGTALVYPTLLAAIGDAVPAIDRSTALGVYRFWRDSGFIVGALMAGAFADLFGFGVAIQIVAGVTVASGVVATMTVQGSRAA